MLKAVDRQKTTINKTLNKSDVKQKCKFCPFIDYAMFLLKEQINVCLKVMYSIEKRNTHLF